jgi:hypothetical protein
MPLGNLLDRLRGIGTIHDPALGTLRTFGPGAVPAPSRVDSQ